MGGKARAKRREMSADFEKIRHLESENSRLRQQLAGVRGIAFALLKEIGLVLDSTDPTSENGRTWAKRLQAIYDKAERGLQ